MYIDFIFHLYLDCHYLYFSELTAGVGYDNLKKVLDIISMISDEQEMQVCLYSWGYRWVL